MRPGATFLFALLLLGAAPTDPDRSSIPQREAGASAAVAGGAIKVERRGSRDARRAVILIPGMGCGGSVWDGTVADLAVAYRIYVVTLAGFDGVPPIRPPLGEAYARAIVQLIDRERLDRPVIVGHSYGVSVAVRAAALAPERVGAVIAVDGTPVFPLPPNGQTPEQRKRTSDAIAAGMRAVPDSAWKAVLWTYVRPMATDPADVERVVAMCLRSDRETIIETSRELADDDPRARLGRLAGVPVSVIVAVPRAAAAGGTAQELRDRQEKMYRRAFEGSAKLSLRFVADSGHMVMWDQPEKFHQALRAALREAPPD